LHLAADRFGGKEKPRDRPAGVTSQFSAVEYAATELSSTTPRSRSGHNAPASTLTKKMSMAGWVRSPKCRPATNVIAVVTASTKTRSEATRW
jgi:hypothetical protein